MLDDLLSLPLKKESLIGEIIPQKLYDELYDTITNNRPVYACVVTSGDSPKIYFEMNPDDKCLYTCRVFWRKEDAESYAIKIKEIQYADEMVEVKAWVAPVDRMVISFSMAIKNYDTVGDKILRVFSSTYIKGQLKDIELFWASNKNSQM